MSRKRSREAAERHGRWAETLCRLSLRLRFYRIVAGNWRSPLGELDLVAVRGRTVAFIEVKARTDRATAASAISRNQRRRIERAATQFLAVHPKLSKRLVRFDVMYVLPGRWPSHVPNAWRADD